MPRIIDEEVAKVIRRRVEKTFGDKVKEFLTQVIIGLAMIVIIVAAIGIFT